MNGPGDISGASAASEETRLRKFYFIRGGFSALWTVAALTLPPAAGAISAALLLVYPLWDAAANIVDSGGRTGSAAALARINIVVSVLATIGVALALWSEPLPVLLIFGCWAAASGLLQFAVGLARRKRLLAGQWPMMLSGIQSTAIGVLFIIRSRDMEGQPRDIALYAAFGALYFLAAAALPRSKRGGSNEGVPRELEAPDMPPPR